MSSSASSSFNDSTAGGFQHLSQSFGGSGIMTRSNAGYMNGSALTHISEGGSMDDSALSALDHTSSLNKQGIQRAVSTPARVRIPAPFPVPDPIPRTNVDVEFEQLLSPRTVGPRTSLPLILASNQQQNEVTLASSFMHAPAPTPAPVTAAAAPSPSRFNSVPSLASPPSTGPPVLSHLSSHAHIGTHDFVLASSPTNRGSNANANLHVHAPLQHQQEQDALVLAKARKEEEEALGVPSNLQGSRNANTQQQLQLQQSASAPVSAPVPVSHVNESFDTILLDSIGVGGGARPLSMGPSNSSHTHVVVP